jgi:hypothetical protein
MKKSIFLLILCTPLIGIAQGVGIGIKAGANFADAKIENVDEVKSATNFHFGAYVNFNLSEKFGITPEVLWSGHKSDVGGLDFVRNYIAVPVMLRFKPISLLSLEAGPQFNFLLDSEFDGNDIKDQVKNNDFGVGFGAGLHLPLGLNVGARYVLGFSNISDVDPSNQEGFGEVKNRTFQLYAGWTLFGAK